VGFFFRRDERRHLQGEAEGGRAGTAASGGSDMKRSAFHAKPKRAARPKPLVPKALGKPLQGKSDHQRSKAHLDLVRAQACIVSRQFGRGVVAHHAQELFPDLTKQGGKISDFLCVPLAHELHDPATPGSLHHMNSAAWWDEAGVDPLRWLLHFLQRHYRPGQHQGADEAINEVRRRIGMNKNLTSVARPNPQEPT
jgi:hypothetical protein